MNSGYRIFFLVCCIILVVLAFLCLIRAIRGPKLADRIMAANMIGTMTIAAIALISVYLDESNVLDICLIYAGMSFVAVIVLTKIYIGIYNERMSTNPELEEGEEKEESEYEY